MTATVDWSNLLVSGQDWQKHAACVGATEPERFHPSDQAPLADRQALADRVAEEFCRHCPVVAACGRFADDTKAVGVWGGAFRYRQRLQYTAVSLPAMSRAGAA